MVKLLCGHIHGELKINSCRHIHDFLEIKKRYINGASQQMATEHLESSTYWI